MIEFEVEILFHSSATPKRFMVVALYEKGASLCCQKADGIIVKYPLCNVFQYAHKHGCHVNSSVDSYKFDGGER